MLPLAALLSTLMIGVSGVAIDTAIAYGHERDNHNLADAAALAGTTYLLRHATDSGASRQAGATAAVGAVQSNSGADAAAASVGVAPVTITGAAAGSWDQGAAWGITVTVKSTHDTFLMRVAGARFVSTAASATAVYGYPSVVGNVLPVTLNNDAPGLGRGDGTAACMTVAGGGGGCSTNAGTIKPPECAPAYTDACFAAVMAGGMRGALALQSPVPSGSITAFSPAVQAAMNARISARSLETYATFTAGSPRVATVVVINGDIGGSSVTPIAFQQVFLDRIDGASLYVHFVRSAVDNAPGTPLDTAPPAGLDSTLAVKLIG